MSVAQHRDASAETLCDVYRLSELGHVTLLFVLLQRRDALPVSTKQQTIAAYDRPSRHTKSSRTAASPSARCCAALAAINSTARAHSIPTTCSPTRTASWSPRATTSRQAVQHAGMGYARDGVGKAREDYTNL